MAGSWRMHLSAWLAKSMAYSALHLRLKRHRLIAKCGRIVASLLRLAD